MSVENFKKNKILIEKGKKNSLYLYILKSDRLFEKNFKYKDFFYLFNLTSIELDFLKISPPNSFIENIKSNLEFLKKSHQELNSIMKTYYYLGIIRIVDIDQRENQKEPKTDLSFIDNEIGMAISPQDILQDLLNIFALYWGNYFKVLPFFLSSISLNLSSLFENKFFEEDSELNRNIEIFSQLREEQFYFIQKCLKMFNLSLELANSDLSLAMSLLVSSIEVLSQKYQWADITFEKQDFGKWIAELIKNQENIKDDIKRELLEKIKKKYMKNIYRTLANFIALCSYMLRDTYLFNELSEELFKNLYKIRSEFLHVGEDKSHNRSQIWNFNLINDSKNDLQTFKRDGKKYVRIIRIPAYNQMMGIIQEIVTQFVSYLYSHRENEDDKKKYYGLVYLRNKHGVIIKDKNGKPILKGKIGDFKTRNIIIMSIKRAIQPGIVVMNSDYHREIDAIDLDNYRINAEKIDNLIKEENYSQAIVIADTHINNYFFTLKYNYPRKILYLKMIALSKLGNYKDIIALFDKYKIDTLNLDSYFFFHLKAHIYALQDNFLEAHNIIDTVLNFFEKLSEVSDEFKKVWLVKFCNSKGEFYQMQKSYNEALKWFEKSLSYGDFPTNEEIKKKINICKNSLSESKN